MVEVAEIFRLHGAEYRAEFGDRMLPSHRGAMQDIQNCRTPVLGGQVYVCSQCGKEHYSYHSCKNRHCPKCQNDQATDWLEHQKEILLPVNHFLVTFTFPAELRPLARADQKRLYNILFGASSRALAKLAADRKYVGAKLGMIGVLHTWTRDLNYHPHVHYVVTGGGLDENGQWRSSKSPNFLVPAKPLALIFRAKVRDELRRAALLDQVDEQVWSKPWVIDLEPVGSGEAAFKYLAPYIFRVAISNNRIVGLQDGSVTFKYKDRATDQVRAARLPAKEFIRRFLQHVLPASFVKVRYYGLLSPANRELLHAARKQLGALKCSRSNQQLAALAVAPHQPSEPRRRLSCRSCGGQLILTQLLLPVRPQPP